MGDATVGAGMAAGQSDSVMLVLTEMLARWA
jgi:hypothetical protein